MDADFSIELGNDDPVLDFPWSDPEGKVAYVDLKGHPDRIGDVTEAAAFPELGEFLLSMNSRSSGMETAKCDVWVTKQLELGEEIYQASHKFAGYVDLLFADIESRQSFAEHEALARELVKSLRRGSDVEAVAELCVRRCYLADGRECFYFSLYVSGYGKDECSARANWRTGLELTAKVLMRIAAT